MLMFFGILGCALMMTTLIYIGMYPDEIKAYLDTIDWIRFIGDWLESLPEFIKIFIAISLGLFMIALMIRNLERLI